VVALHLPLTIGPRPPQARASYLEFGAALARHPRFPGKVMNIPGRDPDWADLPVPEPEPPSGQELAEARLRGEAWMAVIGDRLRAMYPAAEVCETRDLLTAKYPPDPEYAPPRCTRCENGTVHIH
jgi:hypothetical protein